MNRPCVIIGHRGARGLFPENTLEGFAATLALGVDVLELDVALTADGVVVVTHDPALNPNLTRDVNGAWLQAPTPLVRSLRAADLSTYDVGRLQPGTAYAALHPDQIPRDGARIPTLDAVVRLDPSVRFIIELTTFPGEPGRSAAGADLADAVLAVADAVGVTPRVTVEGFDWRGARHLRASRPDLRLAWLTRAETVRDAATWWGGPVPADFGGSVPRAVAAEGGPVWAPDHHDLTGALIDEAHALGLQVIPWTVNEPADMRRLIGWGVDGLVTDRPDRAQAVMAAPGVSHH
jgi:glycerophosphoryl diester phosphodiesterase